MPQTIDTQKLAAISNIAQPYINPTQPEFLKNSGLLINTYIKCRVDVGLV